MQSVSVLKSVCRTKDSETNASLQGCLLSGVLLYEVVLLFGAYGGSSQATACCLLVIFFFPSQYKPAQVSFKKQGLIPSA